MYFFNINPHFSRCQFTSTEPVGFVRNKILFLRVRNSPTEGDFIFVTSLILQKYCEVVCQNWLFVFVGVSTRDTSRFIQYLIIVIDIFAIACLVFLLKIMFRIVCRFPEY